MKLWINGFVVFSVLVVAISLAGLTNGNPYCLIRTTVNADIGNVTAYGCFQSKNYIQDLVPAPTYLSAVTFSNSDIPVLKNGSFAKFAEKMAFIGLHSVGLKDIEENAFEGLSNLYLLAIVDNKLEVIKGEWFQNLPKLGTVSFEKNLILTVEGTFFTAVKSLDMLDLNGNQLTGLPRTEFEEFTLSAIAIEDNPWSAEDKTWLETTIQQKNISREHMSVMRSVLEGRPIISELVIEAPELPPVNTETTEQTGETANTLTNAEIHSPEDLCAFLKDHESPFYTC